MRKNKYFMLSLFLENKREISEHEMSNFLSDVMDVVEKFKFTAGGGIRPVNEDGSELPIEEDTRDVDEGKTILNKRIGFLERNLNKDKQKLQRFYRELRLLDAPKTSSIPRDKWAVHERHCCSYHGCMYGDKDCPVYIGLVPDSSLIICEDCEDES